MKSYACLLVACLPLFYAVATDSNALYGHYKKGTLEITEARTGKNQLTKAKAEVDNFEKIDSALRDGALSIAPLRANLEEDGKGLAKELSRDFAPYAKAEDVVKRFVEAFQKLEPPPKDLGVEPYRTKLRNALLERQKMVEDEHAVQAILTDSSFVSGKVQAVAKKYSSSEYCDTARLEKLANMMKPRWVQPEAVRNGSILVFVIKTRELVRARGIAAKLDAIREAIAAPSSATRKELIGGTFCLVTARPKPDKPGEDQRYVDWPGAEFLDVKGTVDDFVKDEADNAFRTALEGADMINQWRTSDNKIKSVCIIYKNDDPPASSGRGSNGALSLSDTSTRVKVLWFTTNQDRQSEALEKWFPGKVVTYGRDEPITELEGQVMPARRTP